MNSPHPPLRWGVLGTASIAIRRVIPALRASLHNEIAAVASRTRMRAERVATDAGIPRAYGSYEDLVGDPAIDAVYIPLPNHLHVPWSIRALDAGKHVLCEKPLAISAAEARVLADAARERPDLVVMEGFMYRSHPRWREVRRRVEAGAVGVLGNIHTVFSYDNRNAADIRNQANTGGGAWLDIGCYGVSVARWLFGTEPVSVSARMQRDPVFGTDRLTTALLEFPAGTATVTCATQLAPHQSVAIHGTQGRIELELPFNPPTDRPTAIRWYRGAEVEETLIDPCDQFVEQVDAFAAAVRRIAPPPISLEDSIANLVVLDHASDAVT